MDRGAWQATVHGFTKNQMTEQLSMGSTRELKAKIEEESGSVLRINSAKSQNVKTTTKAAQRFCLCTLRQSRHRDSAVKSLLIGYTHSTALESLFKGQTSEWLVTAEIAPQERGFCT